jgi:uncharacterized protein (TIGR02246 family)
MTDHGNDQTEIRDLLATYALTLDVDDVDRCLSLFTDDAEFVVFGKTLSGHDRIRKMLTRAPRGMHLTGATFAEINGHAASVRSQVLFVDSSTHELRPALYDDYVIKAAGRWRFQRRRCQFITANGLQDSPQEQPQ